MMGIEWLRPAAFLGSMLYALIGVVIFWLCFILVDKKAGTVHTGGGGDSQDTSESLFEFYGLDHRRSDPSQIRYFLTHSEAPMLLLLGEQATTDLRDSPGLTLLPLDVPGYQVFAAAPAR